MATPDDYQAVRQHLCDIFEVTHPRGTVYERGVLVSSGRRWCVGLGALRTYVRAAEARSTSPNTTVVNRAFDDAGLRLISADVKHDSARARSEENLVKFERVRCKLWFGR